MQISINDLNQLLHDYESKKKLTAIFFKEPKEITEIKSFSKRNFTAHPNLNSKELLTLQVIAINALRSIKEDGPQKELFINLLILFGSENGIESVLTADKEAKKLKANVLCDVISLLKKSNLLAEATLTWVLQLRDHGKDIFPYSKLTVLKTLLKSMDEKNGLGKEFLPLFFVLPLHGSSFESPDNQLLAELTITLNDPSIREKCNKIDEIADYYEKYGAKISFSGGGGKERRHIHSFFMRLITLKLLTPEVLNIILSSTSTSSISSGVDNIRLINLLDKICIPSVTQYDQQSLLEYNSFIQNNFNKLIDLFADDKNMRYMNSEYFDPNIFYRVIKNYLNELSDYSDIYDLYNGIAFLAQRNFHTKENVDILKDEYDICLTHQLPKNRKFCNTTIIIQNPFSIVQFDKDGIKTNIKSSNWHLIYSRLSSDKNKSNCNYLSTKLEPNEVRFIKRELRKDGILNLINDFIVSHGGHGHIEVGAAASKASLIDILHTYDLLNSDNRIILKTHAKPSQLFWILKFIVNRNINLTQPLFASILQHEAILFANDFFIRVPEHLITLDTINHAIQYCEEAQGNVQLGRARLATYANQLIGIINGTAVQQEINYSQSTHNPKVHKSVSKTVTRLKEYLGNQIESHGQLQNVIDDIKNWANTLPDHDLLDLEFSQFDEQSRMLIDEFLETTEAKEEKEEKRCVPLQSKLAVAKRAIFNRDVLNLDFIDPKSSVTMTEMFALFWLALHDNTLRSPLVTLDVAKNILASALYETQREYTFLKIKNKDLTYEIGGKDKPSCLGGTFNKPTEKFVSVIKLVKLSMATKKLAESSFPSIVREQVFSYLKKSKAEMSSDEFNSILDAVKDPTIGVEKIWKAIRNAVYKKMKRFRSAYSDEKELQNYFDAFGPDIEIDHGVLDELRVTEKLSKEEFSDDEGNVPPVSLSGFFATPKEATNIKYVPKEAALKDVHEEKKEASANTHLKK